MEYDRPPLNLDTDEAVRDREQKQKMVEDAKHDITVELTIDGKSIHRTFRALDVSHIDWNPQIADMAETIAKSEEDPIK
jgi:hypothetical protein